MGIKKFEAFGIDEVMQLWLECNLEVHHFIDKKQLQDDKKDLGFAGLLENYIVGIFVDKNYCPKGIGRQLIIYLKERYKQLSLTVYQKINQLKIFI